MERETGHINDKFRLWEAIEPEDGGKVYALYNKMLMQ